MLFRLFKEDLKRLFLKKSAYLTIIIYLVIGYANFMFIISEQPFANPYFIQPSAFEYFVQVQGGGSGFLMIILPLLVTLAIGDFFIKERQSSMLSFMLMRTSSMSYIRNRITSLGLASSIFLFVCQILLFALALILFPINAPLEENQGMVFFALDLLMNSPWVYSFVIIINSCLMAFCFSTFSVIVSVIVKNFYAAMMLPYFLFIIVSEMLNSLPMILGAGGSLFHHFSPLSMIGGYITRDIDLIVLPLYWLTLTIINAMLATILFNIRINNDKILIS